MGPLKPSDSKSAKQCETPKSAMKKANEKASTSANQLQGSETFAAVAASVDAVANETKDDCVNSAPMPDSAAEEKKQKLVSRDPARKSSSQKAKSKVVTKPSSRTASKRKSATFTEPVLMFETDIFSSAPSSSSANPQKKTVDSGEPQRVVSKPAKNFAPSLSLSQSHQSVNQSSDRIAIFIDGSNLFYAASHLNIEVDYRRLLSSLVRGRRLLRAYFYTGVDPQNEKQRGFLLWLNRHGHRVVSKELTHLPDGSRKANMHVEMAVDMMRISEYCPNITLLGGDGNLAYALEVLSQRGTFIEVVSLQSMTSDSLIDLADSYTDLADLRDDIKR